MVRKNHGGLPTAALHGRSPPPYTFVTGDLNFPSKIWSKSVVHSPDPSEATLKRRITTALPSITTTHHDGGLPSPLSYTLADDDPPPPSIPTQRSRRNLKERRLFRNNGWTKWEAVQLADKLEAERAMAKANWECWKKSEACTDFFLELDDDDQEEARQDERIRRKWSLELSQHAQVMDSSSLSPQQHGSRTKNSAQRKRSKTRWKKTGKFILCDVGSGERLIEEEAEDTCASPYRYQPTTTLDVLATTHSTNDEITNSNEEASIGGSGFSVPSPDDNCEAGVDPAIGGGYLIVSRPSSDAYNKDDNDNDSTCGIRGINNEKKILVEEEAEDACVVSPREKSRRIDIGNDEDAKDEDDNELLLKVQGADLKRSDKYRKRLHLTTAPLLYNCRNVRCIEGGWVSIPSHLLLYTNHRLWSCRGYTGSSLI